MIYFLNTAEGIWQSFRASTHAVIEQSQQAGVFLQESINQATNQNLDHFIQQYPLISKLLQSLAWISSHPVLGILLILLILVLVTSVVRGITRLIEYVSLSLLKTPLKLIWLLIQYILKSISSLVGQLINQKSNQLLDEKTIVETLDLEKNKQQRLVEISQRLTTLQNEQRELLEEASKLLEN